MRPERMAAVVARWVGFYTRALPGAVAARRAAEIDADLHDQIAHERAEGMPDRRITASILSRMVRGVAADIAWRDEQARSTAGSSIAGGSVSTSKTAYGAALVVALGSAMLLVWGVAAMGVIGAEGDPFDLLYVGVVAVGVIIAAVARFKAGGMVRALLAMALGQAAVTLVALVVGKHEVPVSSAAEIVGLNGFFVALFLGSALLFGRAARVRHGPGGSGGPTG